MWNEKTAARQPPEAEIMYLHNIWNFLQKLRFMSKYGNFENRPASRKASPVE